MDFWDLKRRSKDEKKIEELKLLFFFKTRFWKIVHKLKFGELSQN